eukprot:Gb_24832 [translate_table: standard]
MKMRMCLRRSRDCFYVDSHRILHSRLNRSLFWILTCMVFIMFGIGLMVLILFIALHPQAPQWDIKEIHIIEFDALSNVSCIGRAAACLRIEMEVQILAHNPIKKRGIWYDHLHIASLIINQAQVGQEYVLSPFYQDCLETSTIRAVFGSDELLLEDWMWQRLQLDVERRVLRVQIRIHGATRVLLIKGINQHFKVRIECTAEMRIPRDTPSTTFVSKTCKEKRNWLMSHYR